MLRSVYSWVFPAVMDVLLSKFWRLMLQTWVNLLCDLPVILVVLAINRKTIRLRQYLAE